jgi:aldose 1-epimerase
MTEAAVTLAAGDSRCVVLPSIGGSLASWTIAGQPMLRTASANAISDGDPLGMASFPLVPFSNRIGHGQFEWDGQNVEIAKNFAPEPHAVHGLGWSGPWAVKAVTSDSTAMTFEHSADERWPWAFLAEQLITIGESFLSLSLSVTNNSDITTPLAFGHHPYFDQAGASLQFDADRVWMNGDDALPTKCSAPRDRFDFRHSNPVAGRDIDHCFAGWSGSAHIEWIDRPLGLDIVTTPPLGAVVLFIPEGGDAFCFEPVPHINNALNLGAHQPGMPALPPGASFATEILFRAT